MAILPPPIRQEAEKRDKDKLQEIRMRRNKSVLLITGMGSISTQHIVSEQEMAFVINTASKYSPWAAATVSKGFLTAPGGHRIGICGEAVVKDGNMTGLRDMTSLCIRVARDFHGIAERAAALRGNILVLGPPGSGKTTFLRDLIRLVSNKSGQCVAVVDERCELFPGTAGNWAFDTGINTDILQGCSKASGTEMLLRTMGPTCIAVDEITGKEDIDAMLLAGWCGVRLLATIHASSMQDLKTRPVYRSVLENGLFDTFIVLNKDKSWHTERMVV